jgi:hypothetical protein
MFEMKFVFEEIMKQLNIIMKLEYILRIIINYISIFQENSRKKKMLIIVI